MDSNVVIDLIETADTSPLFDRIAELRHGRRLHVNEIIFAEVASGFSDVEQVKALFAGLAMTIEPLDLSDCFRAGQAYADYRRRQGRREAILPDFLIGAQAAQRGWPLVTRDRKGFSSYFPELELIDPLAA
ncbi:MAG: type II toxin-antitoxin system VapC family toxin [Sphingomonadales bacterium]|nr:type II toxin-antitoxin system VapC family toxin [Sphingomonadales bacterium]